MRNSLLLLLLVCVRSSALQLATLQPRQLQHSRVICSRGRASCAVAVASGGPVDATPLDGTENVARKIEKGIASKLDADWCEQDDHQRIGNEAGRLYCEARSAGTDDIGEIFVALGNGMIDMGDCFVGAWDVANMASDVIMFENFGAGHGSDCDCSGGGKAS